MCGLMTENLHRVPTEIVCGLTCFKELLQVYNPFTLKVFINDLRTAWEFQFFSVHCSNIPSTKQLGHSLYFFSFFKFQSTEINTDSK